MFLIGLSFRHGVTLLRDLLSSLLCPLCVQCVVSPVNPLSSQSGAPGQPAVDTSGLGLQHQTGPGITLFICTLSSQIGYIYQRERTHQRSLIMREFGQFLSSL